MVDEVCWSRIRNRRWHKYNIFIMLIESKTSLLRYGYIYIVLVIYSVIYSVIVSIPPIIHIQRAEVRS